MCRQSTRLAGFDDDDDAAVASRFTQSDMRTLQTVPRARCKAGTTFYHKIDTSPSLVVIESGRQSCLDIAKKMVACFIFSMGYGTKWLQSVELQSDEV